MKIYYISQSKTKEVFNSTRYTTTTGGIIGDIASIGLMGLGAYTGAKMLEGIGFIPLGTTDTIVTNGINAVKSFIN